MNKWTSADIPDQRGRVAIVTGANTGLGLETARLLAKKGAQVILACRSPEKGQTALDRIAADQPSGQASLEALDLADLDSVTAFAARFGAKHQRLDLLINNAGVMVPPLGRTKQGFELQIGTNHLGHFALTGRLLPLLLGTPGARVVVVGGSSCMRRARVRSTRRRGRGTWGRGNRRWVGRSRGRARRTARPRGGQRCRPARPATPGCAAPGTSPR